MARTARTVRQLVDEDPEVAGALETVLDRGEDDVVQWTDVNDELTSGQWGRLIETGVLEDEADGFRVADPEGVKEGLGLGPAGEDDAGPDGEPPGDPSWSTWDKTAGLLALLLFPGYYFNSIRSVVGSAVDVVLGQIDAVLPFYVVILLLAVLTGLVTTLLQANLMDMAIIEYYQGKMQALQERQEAARERGDDEELEAIKEEQMSQMSENLGMFKEQFRPMVWSMLVIIPVFLWMYWKLRGGHISGSERDVVMPLVGHVDLKSGSIGPAPTWLVWYFIASLSFSQIVRKTLNVQTTPDT
jgi:uncharacterized membrane protein (DUF106 family)